MARKPRRLDVTPLTELQFKRGSNEEESNIVDEVVNVMEAKIAQVTDVIGFDKALRETAETLLEEVPKNQTWTDAHRQTIDRAVDKRAEAGELLDRRPDGDAAALQNWKQADRELRKVTRRAMTDHLNKICAEASGTTDGGKKLPREFYEHVGRVKRFLGCWERPAKLLLRDPTKRIKEQDDWFVKRFTMESETVDEDEILSIPPLNIHGVEDIFVAPDRLETYRAVMALRNGRSPDIVGVQAEVLKAAIQSTVVLEKLHGMISGIWEGDEPFPSHWLESLGCTIWKKKEPKDNLDNWRMVNIIAITSKVLCKVMHWRMQKLASKTWSHTQYGFKKGSWTMDAVFIVKRIMEAFRTTRDIRRGSVFEQYHHTLYIMFEDFTKAFDSVCRDLLWKELRQIYGVPEHFVELLKKFHTGFKTYTTVNGKYGDGFITTSGVRQGCINGPVLWNFHFQVVMWAVARRMAKRHGIQHGIKTHYYADGKIRSLSECKGLTPLEGTVRDSTFADDAALLAKGMRSTCVFADFADASASAGLTMSQTDPETAKPGKTKVMRITRGTTDWEPRDEIEEMVNAGDQTLPFVKEFLHLGCIQSTDRDLGVKADISRRLKKATAAHAALDGMWRDKHVSRATKGQLTSTVTIPTGLYGSTNWALTRPNIRRLERWWNRITRWTWGVHGRKFQNLGKTHEQLRKDLGVQEIMTYVRRTTLVQIGHLARKLHEDPAKQLLFGHVANRVLVRRTRGARGRQTQPPKTLQRYYRQTLEEQHFPGFDMRIWALLAQDRTWWRNMARAATSTTGFGGPNVESLATKATRIRKQRRRSQKMITTMVDDEGNEQEFEKCPLRCGYVGKPSQISKHICAMHPLHPTQYYCDECGYSHENKARVTIHVEKDHKAGEAEVKVRVLPSCVYKWDKKKRFLRTYPPGTLPNDRRARPYPEGWLCDHRDETDIIEGGDRRRYRGDDPRAEGIMDWNGKGDSESDVRAEKRREILNGRRVEDLSERELRRWMRTKSYTQSDDGHMGWGAKGKLTRYKQRRQHQRVGTRGFCKMNCGWWDHKIYSARTCPLHPRYSGPKPRVRGDSQEGLDWMRKVRSRDRLRRDRQMEIQAGSSLICRRGCGQAFNQRKQREKHERNCVHDGIRRRVQCLVPGCSFKHADEKLYNTHIVGCWKTYHYESPTCTACGVNFTNTVYDEEAGGLVKTGYRARTFWARHVNLYKQTRQVDCKSCGAPHLMPGCARTPKQMGRHFRCSDNYFDLSMGSSQCRRVRPAEPLPWWAQQRTRGPDTNRQYPEHDGSENNSEGDSSAESGSAVDWNYGNSQPPDDNPEAGVDEGTPDPIALGNVRM